MLEITKQHLRVLLKDAELALSADAPENAILHSLQSLSAPFTEKNQNTTIDDTHQTIFC